MSDVELDSPNYEDQAARDLKARGWERVNDPRRPRVIVMREPWGVPVVMAAPRAETNGTPSPGLSVDDATKMAHEQARLEEGEGDGNR